MHLILAPRRADAFVQLLQMLSFLAVLVRQVLGVNCA